MSLSLKSISKTAILLTLTSNLVFASPINGESAYDITQDLINRTTALDKDTSVLSADPEYVELSKIVPTEAIVQGYTIRTPNEAGRLAVKERLRRSFASRLEGEPSIITRLEALEDQYQHELTADMLSIALEVTGQHVRARELRGLAGLRQIASESAYRQMNLAFIRNAIREYQRSGNPSLSTQICGFINDMAGEFPDNITVNQLLRELNGEN